MNGHLDAERILDAYLAPEVDRLPDRVLDAALADIARTPQRRALRVPWRFPTMPALSRMTGIAAVALVAVVGAGGLYLTSNNPGGTGSSKTPAPTATPTTEPTVAPTPPGITGWKTYTSAVYDYTISYPEDWDVGDRATQKWRPGAPEDGPWTDVLARDKGDDDGIALLALQFPGPAGADLSSSDGLLAALNAMCAKPTEFFFNSCSSEDIVTRMCLGSPVCKPVAVVHEDGFPRAIFGDPSTGIVTYIQMGRTDDHPTAARYGGSTMLLQSILTETFARQPQPGETPQ